MPTNFLHQLYDFLLESQHFSEQQIEAQQRHQLEQLVRHARRETSFYNARLNCLFDRDDKFNFDRWLEVPTLKREDLIEHRELLFAMNLPSGHGGIIEVVGSGSTGTPVTTRHNDLEGQVFRAATARVYAWHNMNFEKNIFAYGSGLRDDARGPDGKVIGPWGPNWHESSKYGICVQLHHIEPPEIGLDIMQRISAAYITGRPHDLHQLAITSRHGKWQLNVEKAFAMGANLTADMRAETEELLRCQMYNRYSSKETYDIGHECAHKKLHVNAELMLLEVLDSKNQPCPIGAPGRAVVTPFYNTAQPLIRYELGDLITLGEPCSCGLTLPVIAEFNGREVHAFRLLNGRRVTPRLFGFVRRAIGTAEWQIAQVRETLVEIRYVKRREATVDEFATLTKLVKAQLGAEVDVFYRAMDQLPRAPSGKILEAVCELPPE